MGRDWSKFIILKKEVMGGNLGSLYGQTHKMDM